MSADTQTTYGGGKAITKSDTIDQFYTAIYVGGAGDVVVTMESGDTPITFTAPPVGTVLPIRVKRVLNATSATALIGMQ